VYYSRGATTYYWGDSRVAELLGKREVAVRQDCEAVREADLSWDKTCNEHFFPRWDTRRRDWQTYYILIEPVSKINLTHFRI